jgi:hypothetical protein
MVEAIEVEAQAGRSQRGLEPLGVERIPSPSNRLKRSAAPLYHTFSKKVRQESHDGYRWFVAAFRQAA